MSLEILKPSNKPQARSREELARDLKHNPWKFFWRE